MFLSIPELPVVTDSDHIRLLLIQSGFLTCSSYNLVNGGTLDQMSKDLKPDCIDLTKNQNRLTLCKKTCTNGSCYSIVSLLLAEASFFGRLGPCQNL